MNKGQINVQTENIFPVIKKFLYSEHDIFIRELISNAVDATQKLKTLATMGKFDGELGDLTIQVKVDKDAKTITVSDRGIGMTAEEVDKYINQIAFSGAEEFLEKFKVEGGNIIGHFGLGFYSAFMVSEKVDICTKSYQHDTKAVTWTCTGSPDYEMGETDKADRGTDIVLHVADDAMEFLDEAKIVELLRKYCRFLPIPIRCGDETKWEKPENAEAKEGEEVKEVEVKYPRIINNTNPLWKQTPSSITPEQYLEFYRELYPMTFEEPLFQIHLNVDYPFNLTGILYFPKVRNQLEMQKNKVQLYCNQVFITDQLEGVIPEFMMLLHGVIDSPDIPLNVSRSYLQSDSNVKKISTHITKKVADKLEEMFKNNREDFEKKWDDLKVFIEYGCLTDEKFYERAKNFILFKNVDGKYYTMDEYRAGIETRQKDKNDIVVYLYAHDLATQHVYIQSAKEKGYDVLLMDGFLDTHFINLLEPKIEKCRFARVDADVMDKLIEKDEVMPAKLSEAEQTSLKEAFEKCANKEMFTVEIANLSETELPIMITQNEFMRRFKDMQKLSGQNNGMFGNFDRYNLVVNGNHPLASKILEEGDEAKKEQMTQQLIDLALLSQNLLTGEKLSEFVKRSVEMM
ncbi:MAG: molecular chaperone HtpG [Bacteroidales bacterium]|nr:molecular chaperone HtpG [Bacteroidales bacterium]